ncbi:MAG: FAD binding domain-containing protein [Thermoanaerobaculaceae bacterium]|nr:FAD binding domain-containing protein [Thermoanaerobaculaceae bacterium]TAM56831.1 MAG: xanthine dehydrogenase family protein subunit M [Acidobacteriota bacterium]
MDVPVQEVIRPATIAEALAALAEREDARPIAGGTDLMVQLRDGRRRAGRLVDLGRLGLAGIRRTRDAIEVGAATTMDAIAASAEIKRSFPALASAARQVGAWPIQCRATLGGNLANGSPAADTAPPLLIAEASVTIASAAGTRRLRVADLFLGPGRTALTPGELVTSVRLPLDEPAPGERVVERFTKVGPRREQVISVVSLAGRAVIRPDGTFALVRLAFGSVAPVPVRALTAERALAGRRPDAAARRDAARAVQDDIAPIDDVRAPARYRRIAAAVLLDRFLQEAARG